jgi:DNA-binding NtrC family response regulator
MISQKFRSKMGMPRVLIVDDEVQLAEIYRAVLQSAGAKVKVAYDAADAVDLIESFNPDVIVSDIRMPEVRGDELLVALSSYDPHLPVILVTGMDRAKIAIPKESQNLFHLLHKPVDYDQLIRAVQSAFSLVESKKLNDHLLRDSHTRSGSSLSYEEWKEQETNTILQASIKRAS